MSILPSFLETYTRAAAEEKRKPKVLMEYGIDFQTGQLTGTVVHGIDALRVWVWLCLKTQRFRYPIYSWKYGVDFDQYLGEVLADDFLEGDIQDEIRAALTAHPGITGIDSFKYARKGSRVILSFRVLTNLGTSLKEEVSLDLS